MDSENLQKEFKVFNITIESLSVFYGIFLIGWGVVISLISGSSSLTSYIRITKIRLLKLSFVSDHVRANIGFTSRKTSSNLYH